MVLNSYIVVLCCFGLCFVVFCGNVFACWECVLVFCVRGLVWLVVLIRVDLVFLHVGRMFLYCVVVLF